MLAPRPLTVVRITPFHTVIPAEAGIHDTLQQGCGV